MLNRCGAMTFIYGMRFFICFDVFSYGGDAGPWSFGTYIFSFIKIQQLDLIGFCSLPFTLLSSERFQKFMYFTAALTWMLLPRISVNSSLCDCSKSNGFHGKLINKSNEHQIITLRVTTFDSRRLISFTEHVLASDFY